jgi:3-isopropylmalate dehydratase small subunit
MPCVTAAHDDVERLQRAIEARPDTRIDVDLAAGRLAAGGLQMRIALPAAARESFLDGSWDATGLLLDRYEEVERTAARLPYVAGWG